MVAFKRSFSGSQLSRVFEVIRPRSILLDTSDSRQTIEIIDERQSLDLPLARNRRPRAATLQTIATRLRYATVAIATRSEDDSVQRLSVEG